MRTSAAELDDNIFKKITTFVKLFCYFTKKKNLNFISATVAYLFHCFLNTITFSLFFNIYKINLKFF